MNDCGCFYPKPAVLSVANFQYFQCLRIGSIPFIVFKPNFAWIILRPQRNDYGARCTPSTPTVSVANHVLVCVEFCNQIFKHIYGRIVRTILYLMIIHDVVSYHLHSTSVVSVANFQYCQCLKRVPFIVFTPNFAWMLLGTQEKETVELSIHPSSQTYCINNPFLNYILSNLLYCVHAI